MGNRNRINCTGLYAGTTDCVGVHKGEEAIIDFKTSKKIKKEEWIEDYYLQCCAYAMAHNEMYDTNIKKGVILMVSRDNKFKEFVIEGARFEMYCELLGNKTYRLLCIHYETSSFKTTCSRRNYRQFLKLLQNPYKIEDGEFYIQNIVCGTDPTCEFQ